MISSGGREIPTLPRAARWESGNAESRQNRAALRRLLESGTHRWEVQRLLTRYYRDRKRPLPLARLLAFYTLPAHQGAWRLELVREAKSHSLFSSDRLAGRRIAFVECHGDDLYLRAGIFLKRLIRAAAQTWWLTQVDDAYGVRDQESRDEQTKRRLRAMEARRGAIELGVPEDHVSTGCCRWPLLQGFYESDGRLLAYESLWSAPTPAEVAFLTRYLGERKPDCVVTQPPIDNHPHHNFAGHTLLTALVRCIEQGTIAPEIPILLVGTSREHGYAEAGELITLHTPQEAFAKSEGFTRIYRTQALRRPGQYEREILAWDAASGVRGQAMLPQPADNRYGEEMILSRLIRCEDTGSGATV